MAKAKMRKFLPVLIALGGLVIGGGAGGTVMLIGGPAPAKVKKLENGTTFVSTGEMLAPLVSAEGHLTGYILADVEIGVEQDRVEWVQARMPMLLHAVNMRTYRTPLASGPDGMLTDVEAFRSVVAEAAVEAFGAGIVKQVAITQARPA